MILRNKGCSDAVQDLLAGAVCSPGMLSSYNFPFLCNKHVFPIYIYILELPRQVKT